MLAFQPPQFMRHSGVIGMNVAPISRIRFGTVLEIAQVKVDGGDATQPDDRHDAAVQLGYAINTYHMYDPSNRDYSHHPHLHKLGTELRRVFAERFRDFFPRSRENPGRVADIVMTDEGTPLIVFGEDRLHVADNNPFASPYSRLEIRALAVKAKTQPQLGVGILRYGNGNTELQKELSTLRFIER
jgi:hypothetical protein